MTKLNKKIRKILWWIINTDDDNRDKVEYDVGDTIETAVDKIRTVIDNAKIKDLK